MKQLGGGVSGLNTVRAVALQPHADPQTMVDEASPADLPEAESQALRALILDELRRLREGVLARYGLRSSQLTGVEACPGFVVLIAANALT